MFKTCLPLIGLTALCPLAAADTAANLMEGEIPLYPINTPTWSEAEARELLPSNPSVQSLPDIPPPPARLPDGFENMSTQPILPRQENGSVDDQIHEALLSKQWQKLEQLLNLPLTEDHDAKLHTYARGALLRHQQRYKQAIAAYSRLTQQAPDLAYPRLDLGIMLFENKQFKEAKQQLTSVLPDLKLTGQDIAEQYLHKIERLQKWQFQAAAQYVQTNNVNQASDTKVIRINGKDFVRHADSLPQKAHGIQYRLSASKLHNLTGNHFFRISSELGGVYYWKQAEYNEQNLALQAAYIHQNAVRHLSVAPFAGYSMLGGNKYGHHAGIHTEYGRNVNRKLRLAVHATHTRKYYANPYRADRFNGFNNHIGFLGQWQPAENWLLSSGIGHGYEHTRDIDGRSVRQSVSATVQYQRRWGIRINTSFTRRRFGHNHFLYGYRRHDKEYRMLASLWHNALSWKNIVPRLNYRYQKNRSNLAALYNRSGSEWFLTFEKIF